MKIVCKECNGRGILEKDDKLYECDCERWRRISLSMDAVIRKANCVDGHYVHPLTNMIKQDCFIIGSWADMKAIIKVSIIKHWPKLIRLTSDALIRNVFVGGASKNARSSDFEGEIYNNLQDYMDAPDLMIVRLNELSYKNKAAAGALEEALSYRLDREKATWVLSDIDRPFSLGSHAYSDSVMQLLSSLDKVSIPRILPRMQINDSFFSPEPVETDSSSPPESPLTVPGLDPQPKKANPGKLPFGRDSEAISKPRPQKKIYPSGDPDDFFSSIGQGVGKPKRLKGGD